MTFLNTNPQLSLAPNHLHQNRWIGGLQASYTIQVFFKKLVIIHKIKNFLPQNPVICLVCIHSWGKNWLERHWGTFTRPGVHSSAHHNTCCPASLTYISTCPLWRLEFEIHSHTRTGLGYSTWDKEENDHPACYQKTSQKIQREANQLMWLLQQPFPLSNLSL